MILKDQVSHPEKTLVRVELTNAEVLALHTDPVVIVPAKPNSYFQLIRAAIVFRYPTTGGAAYTSADPILVQDTAGTDRASFPTGAITGTTDSVSTALPTLITAGAVGEGLQISTDSAITAGNGNIQVELEYREIIHTMIEPSVI